MLVSRNYRIEKFIGKIYHGVFMSVPNNLTVKYRYSRVNVIPYSSSYRKSSLHLNETKNFKLFTPIRNCSCMFNNMLVRNYSSKHSKHNDDFPLLTRMKCRGYPSTFSTLSNFVLTFLVIKPQLDPSFSTREFLLTAKKVVEVVSSRIAEGNIESLKGLVTDSVLEEIESNLPKFSVGQRQDLAVTSEELLYSFMDNISLNVDRENNTKSLEILTIHHAFKGIEEIKKLAENINPFNMDTAVKEEVLKKEPRPFVLNYRFSRKFSESGDSSDWIINGLQHRSGKSLKIVEFF